MFKNRLFRTCIIVKRTCISIFSKIGVKTVHTNLFTKKCKLHKFVTCNKNFEKSRLSDMHHPLRDSQADFEMNQPTRYHITVKKKY